jgi:hypothetical protein
VTLAAADRHAPEAAESWQSGTVAKLKRAGATDVDRIVAFEAEVSGEVAVHPPVLDTA